MTREETKLIATEILRLERREKWHVRWRTATFVLIFLLLVGYFSKGPETKVADHIAVLNIEGAIDARSDIWQQFNQVSHASTKAALILVNSGGGTIGDSERLYNAIADLKSKMVVEVLVENAAASGAYLAALASDKIYAYNGSLIGSVGVIITNIVYGNLLEKIGMRPEVVSTGSYKEYPSPFKNMTKEARQSLQSMADADNEWFLELVRTRRGLQESDLDAIREAQVYVARDAISLGLIDGLSSREERLSHLKQLVGNLEIRYLYREGSIFSQLVPRKLLMHWLGDIVSDNLDISARI